MDKNKFENPYVFDRQSLHDFIEDLSEQIPIIERDIAGLKVAPHDQALIAELFRALHNVKGNAAMCKVEIGVAIAHPVETMMARVRAMEIDFSDLLAEVVLLAIDRLELSVAALASNRSISELKLVNLIDGLERLASSDAETLDEHARALIEAVAGFRPAAETGEVAPYTSMIASSPESVAADLRFFRSLALQFESRSPLFDGRTQRLMDFALRTNLAAGNPVAPAQLEAAIYIHDVGMMFLPDSVWLKEGRLSDENKRLLQGHPALAAGLLERMEGWQPAAEMVAQHHEMHDGGGYPNKLRGEQICAGAKILGIIDTFEAITLKHGDRGQLRSTIRAIAEVNACENQFAPEWVPFFNAVIRSKSFPLELPSANAVVA